MDTLTIKDLEVWTHIGVPDEERTQEQRLLVSIDLFLDTKESALHDDVSKTIDYFSVANTLHEAAKIERKTIEKFAHDIAEMILETYKPLRITVTLKKFALQGSRYSSLSITRP